MCRWGGGGVGAVCVGGGVGGWGGRCCVVCSCNIAAVCALMCWADVSVLMRCKECGRA